MAKICLLLVLCLTIHIVSAKPKHGSSIRHIAEERGILLPGEETMDTYRVRRATLNEQRRQSHMYRHKRSFAKTEDNERAKRSKEHYHHIKPAKQGSMYHHLTKRSPSKVADEHHKEKRSFPQMKHDDQKRSLKDIDQHRSIEEDNEHHNAKRSALKQLKQQEKN